MSNLKLDFSKAPKNKLAHENVKQKIKEHRKERQEEQGGRMPTFKSA